MAYAGTCAGKSDKGVQLNFAFDSDECETEAASMSSQPGSDSLALWESSKCVTTLLHEWSKRKPTKVAVEHGQETLSFKDLEESTDNIAMALIMQNKVAVGSFVAVITDRSIAWIKAIWGVIKSGAAYSPMDPDYPEGRLAMMLEDLGQPLIITSTFTLQRLPFIKSAHAAETVEDLEHCGLQHHISLPQVPLDAGHLAYIMFTSGTSGKPKGVMLKREGLAAMVAAASAACGSAEFDKTLQFFNVAFDGCVWDIFPTLCTGGTLVLLHEKDISSTVDEGQVTRVTMTPSALTVALTSKGKHPSLRTVMVAGEACAPGLVDEWAERCDMWNLYGPTETTCIATAGRLITGKRVHIGRPLPGYSCAALDSELRLVSPGEVAELCVAGKALARGYLNEEKLTKEKFVQSEVMKQVVYRTGDLCKELPEGTWEYIGRRDEQIKLRGFRVEMDEIRRVLGSQPLVGDVQIIMAGEQLFAFVVGLGEKSPKADMLEARAKMMLPSHMLPSVHVLQMFPVTPNGKVDKQKLVEMALTCRENVRQNSFSSPCTNTETMVAAAFARCLCTERISRDADFFSLGGHSLKAVSLVRDLGEQLGRRINPGVVNSFPTVASLAAHLDGSQSSQTTKICQVDSLKRQAYAPSFQQLQMLNSTLQAGELSSAYNAPWCSLLVGDLDVDALVAAWQKTLRRHDVMRSFFQQNSNGSDKLVQQGSFDSLGSFNIRTANDVEEALAMAQKEADRGFDLWKGPLVRTAIWRVDRQTHVWLVVMHHALCDGWSLGVLSREIEASYAALSSLPRPGPHPHKVNKDGELMLPELQVQYADYALWQRETAGEQERSEALDYWVDNLKGASLLNLPMDVPRRFGQSVEHCGHVEVKVPSVLVSHLKDICAAHGCSLFAGLLASYAVLLARYGGDGDILVGSPFACRSHAEVHDLIGCFVNLVALRVGVGDSSSFKEVLRRAAQTVGGAMRYQEAPFEEVVAALPTESRAARSVGRNPLVQVILVLQEKNSGSLSLPEIRTESINLRSTQSKFELGAIFAEKDDGLQGILEYNTSLFSHGLMEQFRDNWITLLEACVLQPDNKVHELQIMNESQRLWIQSYNNTKVARTSVEQSERLHHGALMMAESWPGSPAVREDTTTLSFLELSNQSFTVAHLISRHPFFPGSTLVGVLMHKGWEQPVACLAVLRAGAGYVPMDAAWPPDRVASVIVQTKMKIVISQIDAQPLHLETLRQNDCFCLSLPLEDLGCFPQEEQQQLPDKSKGDVAYVIFTSGSTGQPKGVVIEHFAAVNTLLDINRRFEITSEDSVLGLSSASFDLSVWDMFGMWREGGCLVLPSHGSNLDSSVWLRIIEQNKVTIWNSVPQLLELLLQHCRSNDAWPQSLRHALLSGDTVPPTLPASARAGMPQLQVTSLGGATEAAIWSIYHHVSIDQTVAAIPYGKPMENQQIYIFNRHLLECPVGVEGEIYIAGLGLATGYWDDDEITRRAFIQNPHTGQRVYRTGDKGRWNSNGEVEFLGRCDTQIKINGFRVELGEIESALSAHPSVACTCVVKTGSQLVAFVQPKNGEEMDLESCRDHLCQSLPGYMIPARILQRQVLPLTANGKVDRQKLESESLKGFDGKVQMVLPGTRIECLLATIVCNLLNLDRISVTADLYHYGWDSMLSLRFLGEARRQFDVQQIQGRLSQQAIMRNRTVRAMANACQRSVSSVKPAAGFQGTKQQTYRLRLTPSQLWFFGLHLQSPDHFNQFVELRLKKHVTKDVLLRSFQELLRLHPLLRSRFEQDPAGKLWQSITVEPANDHTLASVRWSQRDAEEITTKQALQMNLKEGQLMCISLGEYEGSSLVDRVCLSIHHLVVDICSWEVLLKHLDEILNGNTCQSTDTACIWSRWTESLQLWAESPRVLGQESYWNEQFSLPNAPSPGCDLKGPGKMACETCTLSLEEGQWLTTRAWESWELQVDDILLAAAASALSRWCNHNRILFAVEGHGRDPELEEDGEDLDLASAVGWFTNIVPQWLQVDSHDPVQLVASVREQRRRLPRPRVGYNLLRYMNQQTSDRFQTEHEEPWVSYNNHGVGGVPLAAKNFEVCHLGFTMAENDKTPRMLAIEVDVDEAGALRMRWFFNTQDLETTKVKQIKDDCHELVVQFMHCMNQEAYQSNLLRFPLLSQHVSPSDWNLVLAKVSEVHGPVSIVDAGPLTPLQQNMFLHTAEHPESLTFKPQVVLRFPQCQDTKLLELAMQVMVDRHASLRTLFVSLDDMPPIQLVLEHAQIECRHATVADGAASPESLLSILADDFRRPFDMFHAPLLRCCIIQGGGCLYAGITQHHLITDGMSLDVLQRDLVEAMARSASSTLQGWRSPGSFMDYVRQLAQHQDDASMRPWEKQLVVAGPLEHTASLVRCASLGCQSSLPATFAYYEFSLCTSEIQQSAKHFGTMPAVICFVGWACTIAEVTGVSDVLFGIVKHGRDTDMPDIENTCGPFINIVPLRCRQSTSRTRELVDCLHEQYPQAQVVPKSILPGGRLESLVNYRAHYATVDTDLLQGSSVVAARETTDSFLVVSVLVQDESTKFTVQYQTAKLPVALMRKVESVHFDVMQRLLGLEPSLFETKAELP